MSTLPASIFNDVLGPVMRGPSSSHVAGAARIGALIRMAHSADIKQVNVYFDPNGSLAESYDGHGSDIGLVSGLLGMELTDPAVSRACRLAEEQGIAVQFIIQEYGATHPNNYRMDVIGSTTTHKWDAVSTGGGMVRLETLDGFPLSVEGGYFEYLLLLAEKNAAPNVLAAVRAVVPAPEQLDSAVREDGALVCLKVAAPLPDDAVALLENLESVSELLVLKPVLPTPAKAGCIPPFRTAEELLEYARASGKEMWELAALYESIRGNTTPEAVFGQMRGLLGIMEGSITQGLAGTEYADRILGPQAAKMEAAAQNGRLLPGDMHNRIISYITAVMEVKSSMGVIVAAPTAGSCGGLPGTLVGAAHSLNRSSDDTVKALLAAGLIGVFIAESATFAAEVAGCQVECGAGSGMAAAGLVQMMGGSVEQCVDAASIALQNITGLACDPVANRVEVPCLGKNILGGMNAVASANMALAGFDKVVPLDETIAAVYDIGTKLPLELRCTWGGLGKTKTSEAIRKRLACEGKA